MLWPPFPWDSSHFPLCVCVCACCVPCGDSWDIARPATHRQAPSGSFTRAATALAPTSCSTAGTVLTPAAVRLFRPPPLRWPSAVPPADCGSKPWWWSSRALVTITAPTGLSITLHYGATGPDSVTDWGQRGCETVCTNRQIPHILSSMDIERENSCREILWLSWDDIHNPFVTI